MRLVIANSALRASLAIYNLISNARSWNNCFVKVQKFEKTFKEWYDNIENHFHGMHCLASCFIADLGLIDGTLILEK